MSRRQFITLIGGAVVAWPSFGLAQISTKRPLIAMLVSGSAAGYSPNVIAFRQRLQQLGYVEGRDLDIVDRYGDGDVARMPALAEELVRLKPDIIVTTSTAGALAVKRATATIPIVSAILTDPVGNGLVASYARPGGNVTGILFTLDGLTGKHLELARELTPDAATIGVLVDIRNPSNPAQRHDAESAAAVLGIKLVPIEVHAPDELEAAFQTLARERADWVLVLGAALFISEPQRIAALAIAARLPSIYHFREHVEAGGLISYGFDLPANHRRAADYVDRILKGTKPSELPVEFPTKLALAINLKTAKALGLEVPLLLQQRADEVIE